MQAVHGLRARHIPFQRFQRRPVNVWFPEQGPSSDRVVLNCCIPLLAGVCSWTAAGYDSEVDHPAMADGGSIQSGIGFAASDSDSPLSSIGFNAESKDGGDGSRQENDSSEGDEDYSVRTSKRFRGSASATINACRCAANCKQTIPEEIMKVWRSVLFLKTCLLFEDDGRVAALLCRHVKPGLR